MIRKIFGIIKNPFQDRKGQGITEYAAILAIVVALAVLVSANDGFKSKISQLYTDLATSVSDLNKNTSGGGTTTKP